VRRQSGGEGYRGTILRAPNEAVWITALAWQRQLVRACATQVWAGNGADEDAADDRAGDRVVGTEPAHVMRRTPQDGQRRRELQGNELSARRCPQCSRQKPFAKMPQRG
jgi:hypothetical protein